MNSQQSRLLAAAIVLCVVYLRVAPTFGQSSLEMEDLFRPAYSPDPLMDMPLPTPEAASLGEYLDRPVGYYTGTPQITG
ncbi:MAG TPA: hypothetical protein DCR93_34850, partial [Cytophagales bacterium]|nr:hypothetical protein [Cytophagales bacterium]